MGSITDWSKYPRISRIATAAAADVGRGSETLMTYVRGDLFRSARHLALGTEQPRRARRENRRKTKRPARALVVTGFYIPQAQQPAAETDGPLGALEVCMALRAVGGDAWLISDEHCAPVICAAAGDLLPEDRVLIAPHAKPEFDAWFNMVIDLVKRHGIDTLVFIERVGPARDGRPRNMRGVDIAEWTAPLSQLALLELHTIGVRSAAWSRTARASHARWRQTSSSSPARRTGVRMRSSAPCARWDARRSSRTWNPIGTAPCSTQSSRRAASMACI